MLKLKLPNTTVKQRFISICGWFGRRGPVDAAPARPSHLFRFLANESALLRTLLETNPVGRPCEGSWVELISASQQCR